MRIQSLERAISILNLFRSTRNPLGISEMAQALNLAKTTVHGLVSTLERNGFLKKDTTTRKYRLGLSLFELGTIKAADLEINQRAFYPLRKLSNDINRLCRVAIWDRESVVVTMTVQPQGHEITARQFGPRLPGYCTALGKAVLANMFEPELAAYLDKTDLIAYTPNTISNRRLLAEDLNQTKIRGYSISRMEILPYQAGLGAPVMDISGMAVGAVSTRLNAGDLDTDFMMTAAGELMRTAHQLSVDMGYQPVAENSWLSGGR
ncbi:MAG: IclR family transcriptional regulator [Desulfobacterales bacterium]